MPDEFYLVDLDDYYLLRKSWLNKFRQQAGMKRKVAALICEALIGKGNGSKFVMDSWLIDESKSVITPERLKETLKRKKELDALRRRNGRKS